MKQTFLALLGLFLGGITVAQQSSLYLLYNSSCMDQLEYRYVYTGATVVAYSLRPSAGEHYVLTTGSGGINSPTLPKGTVKCGEFTLNEQFLNELNNLKRQVYIVQQQAGGYLLTPVIAASQVIRSGTYYLYRAPNYSFAIDTSNLVYESNIATGSSSWFIYFNGLKIRSCYYEYSFKREPTKIGQERSEFDFIPGIGVTVERTGMTAADAENNQYRLVRINGLALEDYIATQCRGRAGAPATTAPISTYTPEVTYGPGDYREGDKETVSMLNRLSGAVGDPNLPPPLVNCPEPPGEGYHIVQPGETLNGISRAYGVALKSLVTWNKIKDPDLILVCQKIWVRKPPATPAMMAYKGDQPQANATPARTEVQRQDIYWRTGPTTQPATYAITTQPTSPYVPEARPLIHTVQRGETLYGIGQRYGLSESEMRRLNQYPAYGEVLLQPGMQVFVSDCCPDQSVSPTPTTTTPYPYPSSQPTAPTSGGGVLPQLYSTPTTTQPAPATYGQPTTPATYGQPTAPVSQPLATQPTTAKQPTYFQEYIVREGDTINSVAVKFKVSAQELALVNNKDPNESLIAGQRLLIPRN